MPTHSSPPEDAVSATMTASGMTGSGNPPAKVADAPLASSRAKSVILMISPRKNRHLAWNGVLRAGTGQRGVLRKSGITRTRQPVRMIFAGRRLHPDGDLTPDSGLIEDAASYISKRKGSL